MQGMFNSCSSLTTIDVSDWNTSNVTNMWNIFYNCSGLTEIDQTCPNMIQGISDIFARNPLIIGEI